MARLPSHAPGSLSPDRQRVYDAIAGGRRATGGGGGGRSGTATGDATGAATGDAAGAGSGASRGLVNADGSLAGPFNAWVHAPHIGERIQAVGDAMRFELTVSRRLAELAILVVAREWKAQFEWFAHSRMAAAAGLEADIIEALRTGAEPALRSEEDLAVYALATELLGPAHRIPEVLYQRAVTLLGLDHVVELVNLIGYYGLVSVVLNAFAVPLPDDATAPFAEPGIAEPGIAEPGVAAQP